MVRLRLMPRRRTSWSIDSSDKKESPLLGSRLHLPPGQYSRITWKAYELFFDANATKFEKMVHGVPVEDWGIKFDQLPLLSDTFNWHVELEQLKRLWNAFDGDKNGRLDRDEYKQLVGEAPKDDGVWAWEKIAVEKKEEIEEQVENTEKALLKAIQEIDRQPEAPFFQQPPSAVVFDEKVNKLRNQWRKVTPHMFKKILHLYSTFENDPIEFLQSLTLQVYRTSKAPPTNNINNMAEFRTKLPSGYDVMFQESDQGYEWDERKWKQKMRGKFLKGKPCPSTSTMSDLGRMGMCGKRPQTEYRFVYTTASWMFDPNLRSEFADIIQTIRDMGVDSGVYGTFAARACLQQSWHCVEDLYIVHIFFDFLFIGVILAVGYDSHLGDESEDGPKGHHPSLFLQLLVMLGALRSFVCIYVELSAAWGHNRASNCWQTLREVFKDYWAHPSTISTLAMQLFEVIIPAWYVLDESYFLEHCRNENNSTRGFFNSVRVRNIPHMVNDQCGNSFVQVHPVFLAYYVGIKCLLLMEYLLATRYLGERVIPAYKALTHPSHRSFLLFLMLVVMSGAASYFMFPIKGAEENDLLWVLTTIFRLTIAGDFDLGDLEGVNQVINLTYNRTDQSEKGDLDDGDPDVRWHHGMSLFFIVITVVMNVMLLNVYIGLLSNLYDEFNAKSAQHFEHFRSKISWKLLLARHGWRKLFRRSGLCRLKPPYFPGAVKSLNYTAASETDNAETGSVNMESHIWIAYNPSVFKEEINIDDKIDHMAAKIDDILDRVKILEETAKASEAPAPRQSQDRGEILGAFPVPAPESETLGSILQIVKKLDEKMTRLQQRETLEASS